MARNVNSRKHFRTLGRAGKVLKLSEAFFYFRGRKELCTALLKITWISC